MVGIRKEARLGKGASGVRNLLGDLLPAGGDSVDPHSPVVNCIEALCRISRGKKVCSFFGKDLFGNPFQLGQIFFFEAGKDWKLFQHAMPPMGF